MGSYFYWINIFFISYSFSGGKVNLVEFLVPSSFKLIILAAEMGIHGQASEFAAVY